MERGGASHVGADGNPGDTQSAMKALSEVITDFSFERGKGRTSLSFECPS